MKTSGLQGCNDIGVIIATKWRHYLFYLQKGTVLPKSFTGASGVLSQSFIFKWTAVSNNAFDICKNASYCSNRKYELGDNTPEKWETLTCKHKISDKILANCSPYFTTLQYINYLETKRSYFFSFEVLSDSEKESRKKIWGQGNTR